MVWGLPRCVCPRESTAPAQGNQSLSRELRASAWKPSSQHAGEKRGVAGLLLGRTERNVVIEAEFPDSVSDTSVAPSNDNTSFVNSPVSSKAQLFNVIGETGFDAIGQWAAYKFTVNESGFYKMSMRYKQNALEGMFICRTIKFAGGQYSSTPTVPFEEAYDIRFDYDR